MYKQLLFVTFTVLCFSNTKSQDIIQQEQNNADSTVSKKQHKTLQLKRYYNNLSAEKKAFIKSAYVVVPLIVLGIYNNDDDGFINKYEILEERNEHIITFNTKADNYLQFASIIPVYAMNIIGIKGKHDVWNQTALLIKSELFMNAIVQPLKRFSRIVRPDGSNYHAFPSGHTAQAFLSAEFFRKEYGNKYPFLAAGGYALATAVGALRILNNKHWITDVMTGAGIGIFSVNLAYLTHRNKWPLWKKKIQLIPTFNGQNPGIYLNYQLGK